MVKQPLKILTLGFDWRNIFETDFTQLVGKLSRDRLAPERNDLFIMSWSPAGYHKKKQNLETTHLRARFGLNRLAYDLISILAAPLVLLKRNFRPDIIVVHDFPLAVSAAAVKFFFGGKIVLILGALPKELAGTRNWRGVKKVYHSAAETLGKASVDLFLTISDATRDYLLSMQIDPQKIQDLVPDVIARDRQYLAAASDTAVREKYGISPDKKIILSVGRLEAEKGFDALLYAFSRIKGGDYVLLIVGEGSLEQQLRNQAQSLGVANRVIFCGSVSRGTIWDHYKCADVFILLSKSEGLGLVFWEAMYSGVPVIGRRVGGVANTIGEQEERGFFWEERQGTERLEQIIKTCSERTREVSEKIREAKEYVEKKISNSTDINEIYEKYIINPRRS